MSAFQEFPEEKQRAWFQIERLVDKELASESEQLRNEIKSIIASTLKEHDELFTDDLPYLLALLKNGKLDSLDKHTDSDTARKAVDLIEILAPRIKSIMNGVAAEA